MSLTGSLVPRPVATRIAVTSGKGGVGKTSLAVNLAVAMSRLGHQVGLVDADFALGSVDVFLGLTPELHLGAVLSGARSISEVMLTGPSGIRVIPAGSGVRDLVSLDTARWSRMVDAMNDAGRDLDFLLFDTAPGIGDTVLDTIGLADYAVVITSFEPSAVVDAYAMIKLISANDATDWRGRQCRARRRRSQPGVPSDLDGRRAVPESHAQLRRLRARGPHAS